MAKIGRYRVKAEIGRGSMGVVYLADDPRLRRRVAVKTCLTPPGLSRTLAREFQVRFLREAQAAARLSHPGIVTIYDADADPELGISFIAMEYVPGRTLQRLLQVEEGLNQDWVLGMGEFLAGAIQVAHEAGIIHRDLKPANILVRASDAAAKIADFGVARLSTSELTQSGTSLGSPAYMSPEQIRGGVLDGRSDLFSLAVILYESLCGKRPFNGDDLPSLAYSVAHETPVPVTRRVRGLPPDLDAFFDRALAKDPDHRFPDGLAFQKALEQVRQDTNPVHQENTVAETNSSRPERGAPRPAPPMAVRTGRKEGRFLGLKFAVVALVSLLSVTGFFFWLHRAAYLKLDAKSGVTTGKLSLLLDGKEVYSRDLSVPDSRSSVFNRLLGRSQETFEAWIKVEPGKHEVTALVVPEGSAAGYRDTAVVDLARGEVRRLRLVAGRTLGAPLSLKPD